MLDNMLGTSPWASILSSLYSHLTLRGRWQKNSEDPTETQPLTAQCILSVQAGSQHQQEVNQFPSTSFLKFSCKLSAFPSATALYCDAFLIYPFQKKDESTHFYPVRNMNSPLKWRVTKHKESLYWVSPVRRGYWNVEELKTLSALANGELVWSASFCLSLIIEKKYGRWCKRLVVLQDLFWPKFRAGMKMQQSSEVLHFWFTHAECISLLMWAHARSISTHRREKW